MLHFDCVQGRTENGLRIVALPGAFRSRSDLAHLAFSVASLLGEGSHPVRGVVLSEFNFRSGDRAFWPELSEQVAELISPGDIIIADSMGGAVAALLPQNLREEVSLLLRRPPIIGVARLDPKGPVQKIYAAWLRKVSAGEYDKVRDSIIAENPDYPGGVGIAPEPSTLTQVLQDFMVSNVELRDKAPRNWILIEGGQDEFFHPRSALDEWANWGMPVTTNVPEAVRALFN